MADKKISQFALLAQADIDTANDVLAIVDATGPTTKKSTAQAIVAASAEAGLTNVQVTNVKAKDGTAAITISNSSGNVGFGGTAAAFDKVTIGGTLPTSSNVSVGFANRGVVPSGSTTAVYAFESATALATASFTVGGFYHYNASAPFLNVGSAITNQYGFHVGSGLTGATNNYGFYSNIASGSGRYNFFANGSADNYFAGNTGIGGTSQRSPATRLTVVNSSATGSSAGVEIRSWGDAFNLLQTGASSSLVDNAAIIWNSWAASPIVFGTAGGSGGAFNERMRIDSEGRVGIGGTAGAEVKVHALGTYPTSGGYTRVFRATGTIPSGTTSSSGLSHITFQSFVSTQAASFTMPGLAHFQSEGVTIGAGSTVTNQYGFSVASTLTGATNNYGVYSNIASGSNRWNFYSAGTADNYFAGSVGIGGTASAANKVEVSGTLPTSSAISRVFSATGTVPSGTTSVAVGFNTELSTQAASFTITNLAHFAATQGTIGAGSSVTAQYGFLINSSLTGATNNYGVYSNIASGSGRWNFYAGGTAANYFAGETYVGGTTDQGAYNLQCNGTGVWGAGAYVNGSDARIKEDVNPIASGLDVVEKLNPVTYRYKESWSKDQSVQTGFIAQELLTALDGQVYADGVVQQGGSEGYYSVAYQNIIPILTKAIQELKAENDALKARLDALEAQ